MPHLTQFNSHWRCKQRERQVHSFCYQSSRAKTKPLTNISRYFVVLSLPSCDTFLHIAEFPFCSRLKSVGNNVQNVELC